MEVKRTETSDKRNFNCKPDGRSGSQACARCSRAARQWWRDSRHAEVTLRLINSLITKRGGDMIRKLKTGQYRLYSRKKDARTGKRKNLGTFRTLAAAKKHERAVQFFKRG